MSNYTRITRHPNTGEYEIAEYKDDYFGNHLYGVKFPSDKIVYPLEQVNNAQLKEFWSEDVLEALREHFNMSDKDIVAFIKTLNIVYKARWKRDPVGGEGAVEYYGEK